MNKLNRRFEVLDDKIDQKEKVEIIDHFMRQLKNSGYSHNKAYEIILSSVKGTLSKETRKSNLLSRYRSAAETLGKRLQKKLTEAVNWYRREKEKEEREDDCDWDEIKREEESWKYWRKRNLKKRKIKGKVKKNGLKRKFGERRKKKEQFQTVIFVQHIQHSKLASRIREMLAKLEKIGKLKIKIVKRSGMKLVDLLHNSNVWGHKDCMREECWNCSESNEGSKKGACYKKNIVYETYCILTCQAGADLDLLEPP